MAGARERAELSAVDAYLEDLSRVLRGPRRAKADLLAEARGGLIDATEAGEARGLPTAQAERLAVAEFGEVAEVAPGYQAELAVAQSRRTALLILAIFLTQCFLWDDATVAREGPHGWLLQTVKWSGGAVMVAAFAAIWASGLGARRFGVRLAAARVTGWFGVSVVMAFTGMGLVLTTLKLADTATLLGLGGWPRTAAFLLAPLATIALSARRCLVAASVAPPEPARAL
jgi:hypothetical protein